MRRIEIKRMRMINFKSFRNVEINFDGKITEIKGRNATGKTTVFDAFAWLLFGKNSDDRKDFGVKTIDRDGNVIPRLPHEVSAVLSVDGEEITLCRRLVEKWTKRRGSAVEEYTGNTEERIYNDVPCSVREWSQKIETLCPERVFKFITNPGYFCSQKPDAQRAMLSTMAGSISDKEIAEGNESFQKLLASITGKTLEEYRKEVSAKKKRIKDEMEDIPGRIDERKRDMPEVMDWARLEKELSERKKEVRDVEARMYDISAAYDARRKERIDLLNRISGLQQKKMHLESIISEKVQAEYWKAVEQKRHTGHRIVDLKAKLRDTEQSAAYYGKELARCRDLRENLIAEWKRINAEQIVFNESDFVCPTCGRPFDPEDMERKRKEMQSRFNGNKAERIAGNVKAGKENSAHMKEIEQLAGECEERIESLRKEISALEESAESTANPVCPDAKPEFEKSEEWKGICEEIEWLEDKVKNPVSTDGDTDALRVEKERIENTIAELQAKLSVRSVIEKNNARIAELENNLQTLAQQLAELEGIEFTIQQFSKAYVEKVEERVNSMFSLVRFRMFEQQINGGEVETCVATVDGVPYPDLNNAMRINAGLDIINCISRHEGITAPIFIDNSESINRIMDTEGQQVRLYVSEDEKLTVNNRALEQNLFS